MSSSPRRLTRKRNFPQKKWFCKRQCRSRKGQALAASAIRGGGRACLLPLRESRLRCKPARRHREDRIAEAEFYHEEPRPVHASCGCWRHGSVQIHLTDADDRTEAAA